MCVLLCSYRKVPKFWDAKNLCCNLPKIQTKRLNLRVFCQNGANGIANSEDPDLGLHCLPRPICPKTYDHYSIQFLYMSSNCSEIDLISSSSSHDYPMTCYDVISSFAGIQVLNHMTTT